MSEQKQPVVTKRYRKNRYNCPMSRDGLAWKVLCLFYKHRTSGLSLYDLSLLLPLSPPKSIAGRICDLKNRGYIEELGVARSHPRARRPGMIYGLRKGVVLPDGLATDAMKPREKI